MRVKDLMLDVQQKAKRIMPKCDANTLMPLMPLTEYKSK